MQPAHAMPTCVRVAISRGRDASDAARAAAAQIAIAETCFVLCFVPGGLNCQVVAETLENSLFGIPVFGCSTAGQITTQGYETDALMLLADQYLHTPASDQQSAEFKTADRFQVMVHVDVETLIDEVDKADIEFPNDLLLELDKMEFYCYETQERVVAKHRPIILITSNNEKELPDAFLRRCFFHYIDFPSKETMQKIVDVHYPNIQSTLVQEAMEIFFDVRKVPGLKKKPSTSELIDWLKLLMADEIGVDFLRNASSTSAIPPLHGALVKNEQDVQLLEKLAFMSRRRG